MRFIAIVMAGFIGLVACGCHSAAPPRDKHTIASTSSTGPVHGRPTLGQAIPIPGQPTVLVPFAVESEKGLFEKDDPYRRGAVQQSYDMVRGSSLGRVGSLAAEVRWHNAICRDLKTGEEWTILDRRGIIGRWEVLMVQPDRDKPPVSRAILFIAVLDDTNNDGLLDDRDARVAILADADGRRPRAVSPGDAQVWSSLFDPEKALVFLRVASDTNLDGRIDFDDAAMPIVVPVDGPGPAQPVVAANILRRVEALLGGAAANP